MDDVEGVILLVFIEAVCGSGIYFTLACLGFVHLFRADLKKTAIVFADLLIDSCLLTEQYELASVLIMMLVKEHLLVLGEIESNIFAVLSAEIISMFPSIHPHIQFPVICLYVLFRVFSLSTHLNLSFLHTTAISLLAQLFIFLKFYSQFLYFIILNSSMILYWAVISMFGILFICLCNRLSFPYMFQRKLFHFLMLAIFVPGLQNPVLLNVAFLIALNLSLMLEYLRRHIPSLNKFFLSFIDSRDSSDVIVTHIYLLIGVGTPVLLSVITSLPHIQGAGIISLGVGDTFACLIGYYFGRIPIPHRRKTVEGTLSCWISMYLFACWLYPQVTLKFLFVLAAISIYEAYTTKIDNLVLPLFSLGLFLLSNPS
jgi:dolichol kinase